MTHRLILGTRPSPMALQMANHAKALLESQHNDVEVEVRSYVSTGDRNLGDLSREGGKGAFVKDLEERLLTGEIDCAIHSLKDVPGDIEPHPDLELAAFLTREDPRDALILRPGYTLAADGAGAVLATSSPRRQAFLRQLYPAAQIITLRGNVNTRFRKLNDGEFHGMVLAKSGLERVSMQQHISKVFEPEEMLPAVGQGIMTLQVRKVDIARCTFLRAAHSSESGRIVAAERQMLRVLQGNCHAAIAGYCDEHNGQRRLRAWVASPHTRECLRAEALQPLVADPASIGQQVAETLLNQGARRLIDAGPIAAA